VIASVDERHIGRGYDPYNSADQPHVIADVNQKMIDRATDAMIRRGIAVLARKLLKRTAAKVFTPKEAETFACALEKFPPI
jgi:hypothetical protein